MALIRATGLADQHGLLILLHLHRDLRYGVPLGRTRLGEGERAAPAMGIDRAVDCSWVFVGLLLLYGSDLQDRRHDLTGPNDRALTPSTVVLPL